MLNLGAAAGYLVNRH